MFAKMVRLGATLILLGGLGACQAFGSGPLVRDARCDDLNVEVYFEADSAVLGRDAQALINQAAEQAKGCQVRTVEVVGLADAPGARADNLELSKARAEAVRNALSAARLPAGQFHMQAVGDAGAVSAQGVAEPMRRRVDVTLRLDPAS